MSHTSWWLRLLHSLQAYPNGRRGEGTRAETSEFWPANQRDVKAVAVGTQRLEGSRPRRNSRLL
jgi:hypothetical protein